MVISKGKSEYVCVCVCDHWLHLWKVKSLLSLKAVGHSNASVEDNGFMEMHL